MIEVFADVGCPFTHFVVRRLVQRREALEVAVVARFKAWPLEWVNGAPMDPAAVAKEVEALRAQVAPDLFVGFDPGAFPTTMIPAHALTALAFRTDAALGERVGLALRDALFEDGLDVADDEVLRAIARTHDLDLDALAAVDLDAVGADYEEGRALEIEGSPSFVVGGAARFAPSLTVDRVDGGFVISLDPTVLDDMIRRATAEEDA